MSRLMTAVVFSQLFVGSALAADAPALTVVDPWVRMPPPGAKNTGAFMVIKNAGKADRKLVTASNPASAVTELHTHLNEGGVMKMRQVPFIEVKAAGEAVLKPGSLHVMLIDLTSTLKVGDVVAVTLKFDDGTSLVVQAPVRAFDPPAPGASKPPMH